MAKWTKVSKHDFSTSAFLGSQLPAFAGAAILIGMAVIVFWTIPVTRAEQRMLPTLLGGGLVLIAVGLLLYPIRCSFMLAHRAEVFEEGFKWSRGRNMHKTDWDEVSQVYRSEAVIVRNAGDPFARPRRRSKLRVILADGTQIRFSDALNGFDRLAAFVQQATTERLLPEAKSVLAEGQEVHFSPIRLSRDGVAVKKRSHSWDDIKRLTNENGHLCLWHDGGGKLGQVPFRDIPNYSLFFSLVTALGKGNKLRGGIGEQPV